jgi:hypothetical protein
MSPTNGCHITGVSYLSLDAPFDTFVSKIRRLGHDVRQYDDTEHEDAGG